ncbi:MAG: hypothetical protein O2948_15730 [Proteobacteria bacterium]|nr:hypothetical protein [Pseudomonadota bacterium]MDA0929645.1 hypothetical protein [Pseudomonadota bacterium]
MSWQLLLATATTIPAILIAAGLVFCVFYRRYRLFQFQRQQYLAGPRHIDHSRCRCHFCEQERLRRS